MAEELLKEVQHGIAELFNDGKKTDSASTDDCPLSPHPFARLEKSAVLLATRDFHDSSMVTENPKNTWKRWWSFFICICRTAIRVARVCLV